MADTNTTPLTEDERAELEALRAEKARREEEERARAERAELEALRAEQAEADAVQAAASQRASAPSQAAKPKAKAQPAPKTAPRPAAKPSSEPEPSEPAGSAEKSFGVRMVTSDTVDENGIPTMPMAQKILIAIAVVGVAAFFALYVI